MAHKEEWSLVTVIWVDGEVTQHVITAGPGIADYLAQSATSGFLTLRNRDTAVTLVAAHIRSWRLERIEDPDAAPGATETADPPADHRDTPEET